MKRLLLLGVTLVALLASATVVQAQYQGCRYMQQITRVECEALEAFFWNTNGEYWFTSKGWLLSNQPCNWFGITCNSSTWPRRITRIELINNNVSGSLPSELSQLTKLKVLIIDNRGARGRYLDKMTDALPSDYRKLSNLEILRLSNNELRGSIPFELGELPNLKVMDLSSNQFDGIVPRQLADIPTLEILDLSNNRLTSIIPPELSKLGSLRHLILANNSLWGPIPPSFGKLKALTILDLSGNNLVGTVPESLGALTNLFLFSLEGNQLSGRIPPTVARRALKLNACSWVGEQQTLCVPDSPVYRNLGVTELCGLPLDESCSVCQQSASVPQQECQALETLYEVTQGLDWLNQDGWLYKDDPCTWEGIDCTQGHVSIITLPGNNLRGALPPTLGAFIQLTALNLSANFLEGNLPVNIGTLGTLESIDLSNNRITGAIPLPFASLAVETAQCNLTGNDVSLCVPDIESYRALGQSEICQLPLSATCTSSQFAPWLSFEANVEGSTVVLNWELVSVAENVDILVEVKSESAFLILDTLIADPEKRAYRFVTEDLPDGYYTFRLRQVDRNGIEFVSNEVSIPLSSEGLVVSLPFPNPFTTSASLQFGVTEQDEWTVSLFDPLGRYIRTLYQGKVEAGAVRQVPIFGDGLAGGAYFIRIHNTTGNAKTLHVIHVK